MRFTTKPCPKDTRTRLQKNKDKQSSMNDIKMFFALAFVVLVAIAFASNVMANTDLQETIVVGEEIEWTHADEFKRVYDEIERKETDPVEILHREICDSVPKSPLCDDIEILRRVDMIAEQKKVPTRLLVGISYAESHIGIAFNKPACKETNNFSGIKGRKYDDGSVEWYTKDKGKPDARGCWLYSFQSIEEGYYALANTISIGYKKCENNVRCISGNYVGSPHVQEQSWINNVQRFYR